MKIRIEAVVLAIALAIGALALLAQVQSASATALRPNAVGQVPHNTEAAAAVEKVGHKGRRHRKAKRRHRYDKRRHGGRYRHRRGRHKHFHGGYWYAAPWWLGAQAYGTPYYDPYYDDAPDEGIEDEGDGHTSWCYGKYRSYNGRSDTYRGYDGYDHRCISPYSN